MTPFRSLAFPVRSAGLALVLCLAAAVVATAQTSPAADGDAVKRGEYLYRAAGGCGCHTDYKHDGRPLAGGRALPTPFGTFYSTNLTPDPETGIGRWSEADFLRAMRQGVGPHGEHYFPVFPYTSFSRMKEADLRDLKAYLSSRPAVRKANRPHDVWLPFGWRVNVPLWKWLYFQPQPFQPDPAQAAAWNRGAYLATAVAHCGECHTPRNLMGALRMDRWFAGSLDGPEGELAPNITPDEDTGIGKWDKADLAYFLETGLKPNGDDAQGLMGQVIEHGYSHLSRADRDAIADYVLSQPPIRNKLTVPRKP